MVLLAIHDRNHHRLEKSKLIHFPNQETNFGWWKSTKCIKSLQRAKVDWILIVGYRYNPFKTPAEIFGQKRKILRPPEKKKTDFNLKGGGGYYKQ